MSEGNGPAAIPRAANHAAYLRRMGFDQAADALLAADALIPTSDPDTGQGERAPEPQRQPRDPGAQRRAEGEVLMAALRRDIPGLFEDR